MGNTISLPEFEKFLRGAINYHSVKGITRATVDEWYQHMNYIESESLPYLGDKIRATSWPRQSFPDWLKRTYREWKLTLGRKQGDDAREREAGCPECLDGYVYKTEYGEAGRVYQSVGRCALCQPSEPASLPFLNPKVLKARGRLGLVHSWSMRKVDAAAALRAVRAFVGGAAVGVLTSTGLDGSEVPGPAAPGESAPGAVVNEFWGGRSGPAAESSQGLPF